MNKLTSKQELFAQSVSTGMSQSNAYREAYNTNNMEPETVHNEAYKLMQNPEISTRIDELREERSKENGVTVQTVTEDLLGVIKNANKNNQHAAAISGLTLLAKLHGLLVDKKSIKVHSKSLNDVLEELDNN